MKIKKWSKRKKAIVCILAFLVIALVLVPKEFWYQDGIVSKGFAMLESKSKTEQERDKDKEFLNDSKIRIKNLTAVQQENLYILAKVWGYVKYRHPSITDGKINWDAELFRVMPKVLAAKDKEQSNEIIYKWLEKFPFKIEKLSAKKEKEYESMLKKEFWRRDMSWISNKDLLGNNLSSYLERLSQVKKIGSKGYAFYVEKLGVEDIHMTVFSSDYRTGENMKFDDSGMRLLGLFRYWNIIEYFHGSGYYNRDVDWDKLLYDKIGEMVKGNDSKSYYATMLNLNSNTHDSHAVLINDDLQTIPTDIFHGAYLPPVSVVNIDGQVVVEHADKNTSIKAGDILVSINGEPMEDRLKLKDKYLSLSDDKKFIIAWPYLIGSITPKAQIKVIRNGVEHTFSVDCKLFQLVTVNDFFNMHTHRISKDNIGYITEYEDNPDIDNIMSDFADTKGIILDLRYNTSPMFPYVFSLYLTPKETDKKMSDIIMPNPYVPGAFYRTGIDLINHDYINKQFDKLKKSGDFTYKMMFDTYYDNGILNTFVFHKLKDRDKYTKPVVVIIDERTMSKFEVVTELLKQFKNVTVIGSSSVGANGLAAFINLPGPAKLMFSEGIQLGYKDKQLQRKGVEPDIVVKPTVKGLSEGRDEVLEKAIEIIKSKQ